MMKSYQFLFYKLYYFFKSISNDGWGKWKALLIVSGSNCLILLGAEIWLEVVFKKSFIFNLPTFFLFIICVGLSTVNYFIFLHNNKWREYEKEFINYSKKKSRILGWFVLIFLLGVLLNIFFAFYGMSLIDWSQYEDV